MKRLRFIAACFISMLVAGTPPGARGEPACASTEPIKLVITKLESVEAQATLIGFAEYVRSAVPRFYLRKRTTGTLNLGRWPGAGCAPTGNPTSYHDELSNHQPPGWPFAPFDWSATLEPVSTAADGRILYRATTSSRWSTSQAGKPDVDILIYVDQGMPGSADDVIFANGEEKYLDPLRTNPPFGVAAACPQLQYGWGTTLGAGTRMMLDQKIDQYRDGWDATQEHDKEDLSGQRLTEDTDASRRYHAISPNFPLTSGGTEAGVPSLSDYAGLIRETLTAKTRLLAGTADCVTDDAGATSAKAAGNYLETLSVEDTEEDAERRALSPEAIESGVTVLGERNVAFRANRTSRQYGFARTRYTAQLGENACPGEYRVYAVYTETSMLTGEESAPRRKFLRQVRVTTGEDKKVTGELVVGAAPFMQRDVIYSLLRLEAEPACADAQPGSAGAEKGSVRIWMNLGRGKGDQSAGQLRLDAETISAESYTPAGLTLAADPTAVETVRTGSGALVQVKAPQVLAQVVELGVASYEVQFFAAAQVGAWDSVAGLYAVAGLPVVTYRVENPDHALEQTARLRFTELRGGSSRVTEFAADEAAGTWSLQQGGGLRRESEVTEVIDGDRVKTTTVRDAENRVVARSARTYRTFSWGEELIRVVQDPDGVALVTTFEFYDGSQGGGVVAARGGRRRDLSLGLLRQRVSPNGDWERYTYDEEARVVKTIRPYLDAPPETEDEVLCRVTEVLRATAPDADGDGEDEALTTTVERTLGRETARRHRVEWSKRITLAGDLCRRRTEMVSVVEGAAWDDPTNLVTETLFYATGRFVGDSRRFIGPDGMVALSSRVLAANGVLTTTVKSGRPNSASDDIVDGRCTVTVASAAGQVTSEIVTDVLTNLTMSSWMATGLDAFGRPVRLDYLDGTYETRSYACCGLASVRDRTGSVTSYGYDALGRQVTVTRAGLVTRTTFDAQGRVLVITRTGSDGTEMVQGTYGYDLAGRLVSQADALQRVTLKSESFDPATGRTTRTTTRPGGATVVEVVARDGTPVSLDGTAVAPRVYVEGFDETGAFTQEIAVGADPAGQPAFTEWTKTYTDLAGRVVRRVFADGATVRTFYDAVGRVVRQVDADGVTTLTSYNVRGEPDMVAVDMNGNNQIDLAGTDRVLRTSSEIVTKTVGGAPVVVQRTVTQVWETEGQDAPVTVGVSESSVDGTRTWQTVRGLTSSSVVTYDGAGGRTVTTTTPDGTQSVQTYVAERLISAIVKTGAGAVLSSVVYAYDPHGRLSSATDARTGATTFTYFADDQIRTTTTPDPDGSRSGDGYDAQTTTYAYDGAGRVSAVTLPDGGVTNTSYYSNGAVKRTWGSRAYPVEYAYDPQGRMKTLTTWRDFAGDSGRAVTTWNYDGARGWLLNKRYADGTGPSYGYWPSGRLKVRTWARGVTTTYAYGSGGDPVSTVYSDATPAVTQTYDRAGRLKTVADGVGARAVTYTGAGLLQNETYTAGLLNGHAVSRTYDSLLRASGLSALDPQAAALIAVAYGYDSASRLDSVVSGSTTVRYGYVAQSPLVGTVTFQNAGATRLVTEKSYDKLNRLGAVTSTPSTGVPFVHAYNYNAANQRTRVTREDASAWNFGYDALGQVVAGRKTLGDGTAVPGHDYAWSFDDIGNRKSATTNGATAAYTANALNQYAQRTTPGVLDLAGAAAPGATVTVAVDGSGPQPTTRQGEVFHRQVTIDNSAGARRVQFTIAGVKNAAGSAGEDAVTEINQTAFVGPATETFTHDADGNLTADARWTCTWDGENRLIAVETSAVATAAGMPRQKLEFAYDAQSRRVGKKVSDWSGSAWVLASHTLFVYDGWNMIAELNALAGRTPVRTYVWGLDLGGGMQTAGGVGGLLAMSDSVEGTTHFAATDGSGNVVGLVDAPTGRASARYDYNAFGETVLSEGVMSAANVFRFSTKYTDSEMGWLYYGYRYHAPSIGRWLSRDPIEEQGGLNMYAFVENSPTTLVDPLGLALYAFDGTNNDGYRDEPKGNETNVFILWKTYQGKNSWYLPGVGTNDGFFNLLGLAGGYGGKSRIRRMLSKADEFIQSGDTVADVIGFSRGAGQARDFANELKEKYPCVTIRWMGLFDTVPQEGLPNNVNIGYNFSIPKGTGSVLHLTAGAERRAVTFALTSIRTSALLPNPNPNYREEEMPDAVHSDVGGFYVNNRGLANQALQRMWRDGRNQGVPFGPLNVRYTNVTPNGPNDSRWLNDKIVEFLTRKNRVRKIYYHP